MRYFINGFLQEKLLELGIDYESSLILRWFIDFKSTERMTKIIIGDNVYYKISYQKIIEDLPILGCDNKRTMARKFDKLIQSGVVEKHIQDNNATYFDINSALLTLLLKNVGVVEISTRGLSKSVQGGCPDEYTHNSNINIDNQDSNKEKINKKDSRKNSKYNQPRPDTKAYGEFENVWLKESEIEKACEKYPKKCVLDRITAISEYIENYWPKYLNHYSALLMWLRRNKEQYPDKYKIERSFWDK